MSRAKAAPEEQQDSHVSADEHVPGGLEVRQAMDCLHGGLKDLTNAIGRLKERLTPVLSNEKSANEIFKAQDFSAPLANEIGGHGLTAKELSRDVDDLIDMLQV
jgi:hypothetical protein